MFFSYCTLAIIFEKQFEKMLYIVKINFSLVLDKHFPKYKVFAIYLAEVMEAAISQLFSFYFMLFRLGSSYFENLWMLKRNGLEYFQITLKLRS